MSSQFRSNYFTSFDTPSQFMIVTRSKRLPFVPSFALLCHSFGILLLLLVLSGSSNDNFKFAARVSGSRTDQGITGTYHSQSSVANEVFPQVITSASESESVSDSESGSVSSESESESESDPRTILIDIYSALNGPHWRNNTNWNTNAPVCSWHGITCDGSLNIIKLHLSSNNLVGSLPPSLAQLTALQELSLQLNDISGTLPSWICQSLQLAIIDLTYTRIDGPILDCWRTGAALSQLIMENIAITGSLPASIGNLQNLTVLDLRGTQLTGPIPDSWQHLNSLTNLLLASSPLRCSIPSWIGSLVQLQYLHLQNTELVGTIPKGIGNLVNLQALGLTDNVDLIGPIPTEIGNLNSLESFLVSNTSLGGEIPSSFVRLTNLNVVALDTSKLTGNPFPSLPINILDLSIASSNFVATLDADFCKLTKLVVFITSYAPGVSGSIPACIGNMTGLESIYIDHCSYIGPLPRELFSLARLQMLDLRNNAFSGPIPNEFGELTQLSQVDFSNNLFTGSMPESISSLTQLSLGAFSNNQLAGDFDLSLLPQSLLTIDFSFNNMTFSSITTCASSVRSIAGYTGPVLSLTEVVLSNNPINLPLADVLKCLVVMTPEIINLMLEADGLYGGVKFVDIDRMVPTPGGAFQLMHGFGALITITVSLNSLDSISVVNTLAGIGTLLILDASSNQMVGSIDSLAANPQRLILSDNPDLRGAPTNNSAVPGWGPRYQLPSFVSIAYANLIHNDTLSLLCPVFVGSEGQEFQVDPSYLNWQHCHCISGYRTTAPEGNWCEPCPAELSCSDAMYAPIHAVSNGFYPYPLSLDDYNRDSSLLLSNAVMISCQYAQRCNPHTQAQYQCANGSDPNALLCSRCLTGFFESEGSCQRCASWARWVVPFILTACAVGFLLVQIGLFVAEERRAENAIHSEVKPSNDESASTLLIILTFWLQSQNTLSSLIGSNGRSTGHGFMHYITSTASLTPLGLECIVYGWDWPSQWWLIVVSPVWMVLLVSLIFFIGRFHPVQLRVRGWLNQNMDPDSASTSWRRICFRLLLSLWSLTYMGVAQMILSSWRCERVNAPDSTASFSFLTTAPYVTCGSHQHHLMLIVGITMFALFTLLLPLSMLWYSWKQRTNNFLLQRSEAASSRGFHRNFKLHEHELQLKSNANYESAAVGAHDHTLAHSLLDSSSMQVISEEADDEDFVRAFNTQPSSFKFQSVLATTACMGLRSSCWHWQSIITGRKLLLAGIVSLMPRGSSIAPLLVVVMLLTLLLSHTWIRPFRVQSPIHQSAESSWMKNIITRLGSDFNLLEACLLLQVAALFLAQILAAAAATQGQLLEAGASLRTQAGVVPTLLDQSALEVVHEIILGVGIAVVAIVMMQTMWRLYTKWQKARAAAEVRD